MTGEEVDARQLSLLRPFCQTQSPIPLLHILKCCNVLMSHTLSLLVIKCRNSNRIIMCVLSCSNQRHMALKSRFVEHPLTDLSHCFLSANCDTQHTMCSFLLQVLVYCNLYQFQDSLILEHAHYWWLLYDPVLTIVKPHTPWSMIHMPFKSFTALRIMNTSDRIIMGYSPTSELYCFPQSSISTLSPDSPLLRNHICIRLWVKLSTFHTASSTVRYLCYICPQLTIYLHPSED